MNKFSVAPPFSPYAPIDCTQHQAKQTGEVDPDGVVIRHTPVLPAVTQ